MGDGDGDEMSAILFWPQYVNWNCLEVLAHGD